MRIIRREVVTDQSFGALHRTCRIVICERPPGHSLRHKLRSKDALFAVAEPSDKVFVWTLRSGYYFVWSTPTQLIRIYAASMRLILICCLHIFS
jgi:hypothetical protein